MSMPETTRRTTYRKLRATLSALGLRWRRELSSLVPERLKLWWLEAGPMIAVSLNESQGLILFRPVGERLEEIGAIDLADPGAATSAARILHDVRRRSGAELRVMLCLDQNKVLERELALPLAVEENLRQTISFELDRLTPFRASEAQFDFRVRERKPEVKQLTLDLLVAKRSVVEESLGKIDALRLPITGVTSVNDILNRVGDCRNLFPEGTRRADQSTARKRWRIAAVLITLVLISLAVTIPLWQKRTAAIDLLAPLYEAKHAAEQTDVLRGRLDKLVETHNLLPDKKWAGHSAFRVLEELSIRLPDNTFVIQLDFDGKTIQVQGETAASAELIELLEASPLFKDVGYKAQLTKIQGTTYDRFHIAANLEAAEKAVMSIESSATADKPTSVSQ